MDTKNSCAKRFVRGAWACCLPLMAMAALIPAWAGTVAVRVVDANGAPVAQAVASLEPVHAPVPSVAPAGSLHAVMDQKGLRFVPQVLPVRVGTLVKFPDSDQVHHDVYSFSRAKRFQLQLYSGSHAPPVRFNKPGVVVLGCNIHDWMLGFIVVLDTPYFGKTGGNGQVFLSRVPPGSYVLHLWHPRLKGTKKVLAKPVTVTANGVLHERFKVSLHPPELTNKPPPGLNPDRVGGDDAHH
jgi:plastocyanin